MWYKAAHCCRHAVCQTTRLSSQCTYFHHRIGWISGTGACMQAKSSGSDNLGHAASSFNMLLMRQPLPTLSLLSHTVCACWWTANTTQVWHANTLHAQHKHLQLGYKCCPHHNGGWHHGSTHLPSQQPGPGMSTSAGFFSSRATNNVHPAYHERTGPGGRLHRLCTKPYGTAQQPTSCQGLPACCPPLHQRLRPVTHLCTC